ncbi:hypothetical protein SCP_0705800 [Sparassis crispa]|uniref:F-box domain-containing protein n=1 Tax=Sparassis crispa TaxID=139825 RepID=A0A401GT91_9APHY|nr:hypothetical protein SCP_0705800 [Sparassis crispa]GBE85393.1 hypothetical protein SCP_0705800 [Sparassis crispa]
MHAGTSLEDLELHLVYPTTAFNVQDLNIGQCTALRDLTFRVAQSISLAEILRMISPNCRLHKLDILMVPGEVDCEWESAACLLDEQQFLTLREFRLDVSGDEVAEEEKRRISDRFDALHRRGVDVKLHLNPWDWEQYSDDSSTT